MKRKELHKEYEKLSSEAYGLFKELLFSDVEEALIEIVADIAADPHAAETFYSNEVIEAAIAAHTLSKVMMNLDK